MMGSEGYFVPLIQLTEKLFLTQTVGEGLFSNHSIVAFYGKKPVVFC